MATRLHRFGNILAASALLGSCAESGPGLEDPTGPVTEANLFARYVSLGNSITAGFQSGGINDSTQKRAYPVLLAGQAGASLRYPALAPPGCPPPLGMLGGSVGEGKPGAAPAACARLQPAEAVHNLAVPGAMLASLFDNSIAANSLTGSFSVGAPRSRR